MSFVSLFIRSSLTGWTTRCASAYVGSVALAQVTGALWYSPLLFVKPWMLMSFPDIIKTEQDVEAFYAKEGGPTKVHPASCYASAMAGAALSFLILRGMIRMAPNTVKTPLDGAAMGIILSGAGTVFGMMHPFFEGKPFLLYVINHGYHIVSFAMAGALLTSFQ